MQKNCKIAIATIALSLTTAICTTAWTAHQQKSEEKAAPQSAGKSSPEMDRLKFYLGEWDYTETYPQSGEKNTCLLKSKQQSGNLEQSQRITRIV